MPIHSKNICLNPIDIRMHSYPPRIHRAFFDHRDDNFRLVNGDLCPGRSTAREGRRDEAGTRTQIGRRITFPDRRPNELTPYSAGSGPALRQIHQQLRPTTLLNSHCAHLLICREAFEDLPDAILNECLHTFTFSRCQQFSGATPSLNERMAFMPSETTINSWIGTRPRYPL